MTRHELKEQLQHDQFTDAVSRSVDYVTLHRQAVIRWAVAAVLILAIAGAAFWYTSHRRAVRQQNLQAAFDVLDAQVGPATTPGVKTFPTQEAKTQASIKALSQVVDKDGNSTEGLIARYYRGTLETSQNNAKAAEADLRAVASSKSGVAALSKIALAQLLAAQNKVPEAQELLRSVVNSPNGLVSKDQAQILLARLDESANPQQAKKVLQSLRGPNQRPAVSRAVDTLTADLSK